MNTTLPDDLVQWITENCADTDSPLEFWLELAEEFSKLSKSEAKWLIDHLRDSINE